MSLPTNNIYLLKQVSWLLGDNIPQFIYKIIMPLVNNCSSLPIIYLITYLPVYIYKNNYAYNMYYTLLPILQRIQITKSLKMFTVQPLTVGVMLHNRSKEIVILIIR